MIIETTYIDIIKKNRKIANLQSNMTNLTKFERRFQTFLQFLFFEYDVIRDAINVQNKSNVDKYIQKLQKKKTQFAVNKIIESTLLIKNDRKKKVYRIFQRRFFNFDENFLRFKFILKKKRKTICFLCNNSHRIRNCDLLKKLKK